MEGGLGPGHNVQCCATLAFLAGALLISPASAQDIDDGALLPSPRVERARLAEHLSRELESTLQSLDGVRRARVHLALPPPAPLLGDTSPEASASVLLRTENGTRTLEDDQIQLLIASSVHDLRPDRVSVIRAPTAPVPAPVAAVPELVRVGPIRVDRESAGSLRAILAVAIAASLALMALVLSLWLRLRRRIAREELPFDVPRLPTSRQHSR